MAFYLRDVAGAFHSYYAAERFLVDDAELARARLALLVGDAAGAAQRARACSACQRARSAWTANEPALERRPTACKRSRQRGGFAMGLIVGLLIGLALALGVALYVTKVPVPFVNKVPQRTAEQDAAETEKNKNWDPNAPLSGKARRSAPAARRPPPPPTAVRRRPRPSRRCPTASGAGAARATRPPSWRRAHAPAAVQADSRPPTRSPTSCRPAPSRKPEDAEQQRAGWR